MSKEQVLGKFMILCWAAFIANLGHLRPMGCRLDTPAIASHTCSILIVHIWTEEGLDFTPN